MAVTHTMDAYMTRLARRPEIAAPPPRPEHDRSDQATSIDHRPSRKEDGGWAPGVPGVLLRLSVEVGGYISLAEVEPRFWLSLRPLRKAREVV